MKLLDFKQIDGYKFFLTFDDGVQKEVDLNELLEEKVELQELNSASIDKDWGCLEFKNGLVDIEPKTLYRYSLGKS